MRSCSVYINGILAGGLAEELADIAGAMGFSVDLTLLRGKSPES